MEIPGQSSGTLSFASSKLFCTSSTKSSKVSSFIVRMSVYLEGADGAFAEVLTITEYLPEKGMSIFSPFCEIDSRTTVWTLPFFL